MSARHDVPLPQGLGFLDGAAPLAVDADAALRRLRSDYFAAVARHEALGAAYEADTTEGNWNAYSDALGEALNITRAAAEVSAQTLAGLSAKAQITFHINESYCEASCKGWGERYDGYEPAITHSLIADVMRLLGEGRT